MLREALLSLVVKRWGSRARALDVSSRRKNIIVGCAYSSEISLRDWSRWFVFFRVFPSSWILKIRDETKTSSKRVTWNRVAAPTEKSRQRWIDRSRFGMSTVLLTREARPVRASRIRWFGESFRQAFKSGSRPTKAPRICINQRASVLKGSDVSKYYFRWFFCRIGERLDILISHVWTHSS